MPYAPHLGLNAEACGAPEVKKPSVLNMLLPLLAVFAVRCSRKEYRYFGGIRKFPFSSGFTVTVQGC